MTGMPRATASIAAVELTVTRPSAVSSACDIDSVDTTRFDGSGCKLRRAGRGSRDVGRGSGARRLTARSFTTTRLSGSARAARTRRRATRIRSAVLARNDRLRGEDEVGPAARGAADAGAVGEGQPGEREALRQTASARQRGECSHLAGRVQHEQVALDAVYDRGRCGRDRDAWKARHDHRPRLRERQRPG